MLWWQWIFEKIGGNRKEPFGNWNKIRRIGLRRNDPPPAYDNTLEKDLEFFGRILLRVEDVWNNDLIRETSLDGEIFNRLAIYERLNGGYVAEQLRYNPRVIINPNFNADESKQIPFTSFAQKFATLDGAIAWIRNGILFDEGQLCDLFEEEIGRHETGIKPPSFPHTSIDL
jgi:hypothetical protein